MAIEHRLLAPPFPHVAMMARMMRGEVFEGVVSGDLIDLHYMTLRLESPGAVRDGSAVSVFFDGVSLYCEPRVPGRSDEKDASAECKEHSACKDRDFWARFTLPVPMTSAMKVNSRHRKKPRKNAVIHAYLLEDMKKGDLLRGRYTMLCDGQPASRNGANPVVLNGDSEPVTVTCKACLRRLKNMETIHADSDVSWAQYRTKSVDEVVRSIEALREKDPFWFIDPVGEENPESWVHFGRESAVEDVRIDAMLQTDTGRFFGVMDRGHSVVQFRHDSIHLQGEPWYQEILSIVYGEQINKRG